jgi:hypothetical protein
MVPVGQGERGALDQGASGDPVGEIGDGEHGRRVIARPRAAPEAGRPASSGWRRGRA